MDQKYTRNGLNRFKNGTYSIEKCCSNTENLGKKRQNGPQVVLTRITNRKKKFAGLIFS